MAACSARVVLALVLVLGVGRGSLAQESPAPPRQTLHAVTIEGLTVFTEPDLVRRLGLEVDRPLPKSTQDLARDVESVLCARRVRGRARDSGHRRRRHVDDRRA